MSYYLGCNVCQREAYFGGVYKIANNVVKINEVLLGIMIEVYAEPGLTGREISNRLMVRGLDTSKREVNQLLYGHIRKKIFWREVDNKLRPSWYLTEQAKTAIANLLKNALDESSKRLDMPKISETTSPYPAYLHLYPWQLRALENWEEANHIGVIEAVTGTGKTRVALAAIDKHFREGWKTAVIVPTLELQHQWVKVITNDLVNKSGLNIKVGQLGGGKQSSLNNHDVLVTTASSACNYYLHEGSYEGLLIADECHRYGAENWTRGLEEKFTHRLGLTATYERSDNGIAEYLNPYFNGVCYTLGYDEALADGVIAQFKIAFIGFEFYGDEKNEYEYANRQCVKYRRELIENYGVTAEPFGDFMKEINKLSDGGGERATMIARYYISNFNKRRQLLSNCAHKNNGLKMLAPAVKAAERTIIFTQTKDAASLAAKRLESCNINAAMLDATMDKRDRRDVLLGFEDGEHEVVAAPMLLDEGIDVPAADLAIVVASSRNKRQMIQRMGRVLRKKNDGRLARIAIFYIKDTSEDPKMGAQQTFIELISGSANDISYFDANNVGSDDICNYLNEWGADDLLDV